MRHSLRLGVVLACSVWFACSSAPNGDAVEAYAPMPSAADPSGELDPDGSGTSMEDDDHHRAIFADFEAEAAKGNAPATPPTPAAPLPLLASGLHPAASDGLRAAGVTASRIMQTIGSAAASAGTHASDGLASGKSYTAAVDLRTKDLTQAQTYALLERLATAGFAAYYRWPGHDGWPASEAPHIHAVYAGCAMKRSLRDQVHDWLAGKNGLASHTTYTFFKPTQAMQNKVRTLFLANNPMNN